MIDSRYLEDAINIDLEKKMVLVAGPRQVGKTSLSLKIGGKSGYLNWDIPEHREKILLREFPPAKNILILDEIHKNRDWRSFLKSLTDDITTKRKILVTGSAKLDAYRRGGDSLQGRYFFHRLHPFTGDELKLSSQSDWKQLLHLGGFPEPFLSGDKNFSSRWCRSYRVRLLEDEIRSLENIIELTKLELLGIRLPNLVGSPLSLNALREDLNVSHQTVDRWLQILDNVYYTYRVSPLGMNKLRTVKKEQKLYLWNWALPPEDSIRFENMVAGHLQKWIHRRQDGFGEEWDLRYFRDTAGREVDFILTLDEIPKLLLECKLSDTELHPPLRYLKDRLPKTESWQVYFQGKKDYETPDEIRVSAFPTFWKEWLSKYPM
jgi:hypothetical protein